MSQQLVNDFDNFFKVVSEIGKHDFGKPSKSYPRNVSMKNIDSKLPPNSVLENGSNAIRTYWNTKAQREGNTRAKASVQK